LITESGVKKAYDCPLDSGLHRYGVGQNARFIPGFSMPDQGVLILKNEGILVAVQPYHFPYAPHESFGDFLLVADSITYTNAQWRITSTQTSISGPIPPKNLPKNPPKALFGGENGKNYVQFSHSLYPYLHMLLPHLADQWQPEAPYLLP
ncbi:MAG TPA: hypothetical protein DEQ46_08545, partial [Cryomorphaceae bacterium]|nr:hypothetical protein [Cryomorphaceae bacterium]